MQKVAKENINNLEIKLHGADYDKQGKTSSAELKIKKRFTTEMHDVADGYKQNKDK